MGNRIDCPGRRALAPAASLTVVLAVVLLGGCGDSTTEPVGALQADPDPLQFGAILVGQSKALPVTLRAPEGESLEGFASISGDTAAYSLETGAGSFALRGGEAKVWLVRYSPEQDGSHAAHLSFGTKRIAATRCSGRAYSVQCEVRPQVLDFDSVIVNNSKTLPLTIHNHGPGKVKGAVTRADTSTVFQVDLYGGTNQFEIAERDSFTTWITYRPVRIGPDSCRLRIDLPVAQEVVCHGIGQEPPPQCRVDPEYLSFPPLTPGTSAERSVLVQNYPWGGRLHGTVSLLEPGGMPVDESFSIVSGEGPFILAPGESLRVTVRFTAYTYGTHSSYLDLGNRWCGPVPLWGEAGLIPVLDGSLPAYQPSWSPAGDRLAFSLDGRISVVAVAGGAPTPLATGTDRDSLPRWSPDGTAIAFQSVRDGRTSIWRVSSDGASTVQLTHPEEPAEDVLPVWSPVGTRIAFESNRNGRWDLWVVDATGGEPVCLTTEAAPVARRAAGHTWSPFGVAITYTGRDPDGYERLYTVPATGGEARRTTSMEVEEWSPAWSPDGTTIAYLTQADFFVVLTTVPVSGGDPWRRYYAQNGGWWPRRCLLAWSPDGASIAFDNYYDNSTMIFAAEGDEPLRLPVSEPAWSPDGSKLAVRSGPGALSIAILRRSEHHWAGRPRVARVCSESDMEE